MRSWRLILIYGFLLWLIPFCVAVSIFSLKKSGAPLFETIMPVTLAACGVVFSLLYFRGARVASWREGLLVGAVWFAVSVAIDLVLFSSGPMKMSFDAYMQDIGLTYLIYPIVTTGFGCRQR